MQNETSEIENKARTTYKVPAENLELLRERVADLNKRVRRLVRMGHDVAEVTLKIGELRAEKTGTDHPVERVYADVELLTPRAPKIDGWQFVAALTHVEEAGTVIRVCPGAEVAEGELRQYRDASPSCDHCQTTRQRSETFVVRDQGGTLRQVGRQCLAAYTGLTNPETLCRIAEMLFCASDLLEDAEDDDFEGGRGRSRGNFGTIASYLPFVCCSIRENGWLSRTAAREQGRPGQATADLALSCGLFPPSEMPEKDCYHPTEADHNLASAAISFCAEHFDGCDVEKLSDYEASLRVAMASGILHPKLTGIVASAIGFYRRDLERRAKNDAWAKMVASSKFQGTVDERGLFEDLKVLTCREWGSDFGTTYFYSLVDEAGNAFAYFASRDMSLAPGQIVSFRATVKKHEMRTPKFAGAPTYAQTTLTRCQLIVRARLESQEVKEMDLGKRVTTNPEEVARGIWAQYAPVLEKVHLYHLTGPDGRRYVITSKSKKRGLAVGTVAVLSVSTDVTHTDRECPAGLVEVTTPSSSQKPAQEALL